MIAGDPSPFPPFGSLLVNRAVGVEFGDRGRVIDREPEHVGELGERVVKALPVRALRPIVDDVAVLAICAARNTGKRRGRLPCRVCAEVSEPLEYLALNAGEGSQRRTARPLRRLGRVSLPVDHRVAGGRVELVEQ